MTVVVEHGSSRSGRWLRRNRIRIALWAAVLEAALVLFGLIPKWPAVLVAVALIALYAFVGRGLRSDTLRQTTWIAAVSQLLIVALPLLIGIVTLVAFVVLAILVVAALVFLFVRRR
jgi:hypothetical protein